MSADLLGPDNLTVADDTILKFLKEIDLYTKIQFDNIHVQYKVLSF